MEEVSVNWCEKLGTVVANEEVFEGTYIETGDPVERRKMKQWMLKITAYAERLIQDLDQLDWPESIKEMQRNWIGKSEGALVHFPLENSDQEFVAFTTRIDTLFGVTFCVTAADGKGVQDLATPEYRDAVIAYSENAKRKSTSTKNNKELEKTGVFTGRYLLHPISGKKIPLWVADYVEADYGTGFVMGVPAHDERDFQFAKKYNLPIVPVIVSETGENEEFFSDDGVLINSDIYSGQKSP